MACIASSACSSSSPSGGKWLKLFIDEGTNLLKQFLLFSINPDTLEIVLKRDLTKLSQLKSRGVIFADQWETTSLDLQTSTNLT